MRQLHPLRAYIGVRRGLSENRADKDQRYGHPKNMKINELFIASVILLMTSLNNNSLKAENVIHDYGGESILYLISPFGRSEYNDHGVVDLNGIKVNLVTLKTKILFFEDMERIYSDPESGLPYRLERVFSKLWFKEYMTEEYDQKNFTISRKKFKAKKLVNEKMIKGNKPIQNGVLLPFRMRGLSGLAIGWQFIATLPDEFKFELASIEEITVPAGKFQAYHFKSIPDKFEIWINKNDPRVPLKILGKSIFGCSLLMKEYTPPIIKEGKP